MQYSWLFAGVSICTNLQSSTIHTFSSIWEIYIPIAIPAPYACRNPRRQHRNVGGTVTFGFSVFKDQQKDSIFIFFFQVWYMTNRQPVWQEHFDNWKLSAHALIPKESWGLESFLQTAFQSCFLKGRELEKEKKPNKLCAHSLFPEKTAAIWIISSEEISARMSWKWLIKWVFIQFDVEAQIK